MTTPNIDNYSPLIQVFLGSTEVTEQGCWEWQGTRRKGYGRQLIAGKQYSVHRLIYQAVVGPIPAGHVVMHNCDNPPCCRPDHLKAGTQAENLADMFEKGRGIRKKPVDQAFGSHHGNAKLSEDVVQHIRTQVEAGASQSELARRYGVHQSSISRALNGKLWAHV